MRPAQTTPLRPTSPPAPRRLAAAALAAALCLGAAACSGDDEGNGDKDTATGASPTTATDEVATQVSWGAVAGKVGKAKRDQVKEAATGVVDGWLDAAYAGGEWPRTDFSGAFAGFTDGAQAKAEADLDLMTNSAIGGQVESVEVLKRTIKLDALGVKGKATGVTARFKLKFRTDGEVEGTETVSGRLFLTPTDGGWRVFGYDVARSGTKGAA